MRCSIGVAVAFCACLLFSCAKKENADVAKPAAAAEQATAGPRAVVHLQDGGAVPGSIVASSQTHVIVAGDDGIERKIPLQQVKSIEYGESQPAAGRAPPPPPVRAQKTEAPAPVRAQREPQPQAPPQAPPAVPPPAEPTATLASPAATASIARTVEVPAGSEVSVRTNETIDSGRSNEGQSFAAQVTRDVKDAAGLTVVPRGSPARIVIKSASKGGRFRGASDLVLDLQSVVLNGKSYAVDTAEVSQQGQAGLGANKRTATYTGGGAALGAIIGAIAGGGKGAAIGAGAGAGAGALTQILTKGGAIRVPVESVLTFRLDQPLRVTTVD